MKKFIKYLFFVFLYIVVTIIIAYMILAQTIPDDGQCHMMDRPLVIHYILAAIITALPTLVLIYSRNRKQNKNKNK
ncbi:MAG: Holliday junction ATP-dependent DNA helicase RuvA [Rickettsia endosymbiont of Argas persicus]